MMAYSSSSFIISLVSMMFLGLFVAKENYGLPCNVTDAKEKNTKENKSKNGGNNGDSILTSSCGVLITSQGGVGSSAFMGLIVRLSENEVNPLAINFDNDSDQFKHKPATYWNDHDSRAIVASLGVGYGRGDKTKTGHVRVCFGKVLVIIGDPIHTIESTYRRFKVLHLNKLRAGSGLPKYPKNTTLEDIYKSIAKSEKDEVGISNYISSWRDAQLDRAHWPEVRLVTAKTLYNNATNLAKWIGVSGKDLEPFKRMSYQGSKHHAVRTMKKVVEAYSDVVDIVKQVEDGKVLQNPGEFVRTRNKQNGNSNSLESEVENVVSLQVQERDSVSATQVPSLRIIGPKPEQAADPIDTKMSIHEEKDIVEKLSGGLDFANAPIPNLHGKDIFVNIFQKSKTNMNLLVRQNSTKMPPQEVCDVLLESFKVGEDTSTSAVHPAKRVSYSLLSCEDHRLGNKLPLIYVNWLLARSAGADFHWNCLSDDTETMIHLLQELHLAKNYPSVNNAVTATPSLQSICQMPCGDGMAFRCRSLGLAAELIRQDLQMVTSMIEPTLPTPSSDVVIHLRCGDIFHAMSMEHGFMSHSTYVHIIQDEYGLDGILSSQVNASIGIITQPYDSPSSTRKEEIQYGPRCRIIVNDLINTLETTFPASRVEVFNQPEHMAIPRAWTRMAKAKRVTISSPSSFALWPTLASNKAYICGSTQSPWIDELSQHWDSLEVFKAPLLNRWTVTGKTAKDPVPPPPLSDWKMDDIIGWLRDN